MEIIESPNKKKRAIKGDNNDVADAERREQRQKPVR